MEYYDLELVLAFHRGSEPASYYFIDRYLFANANGYSGTMFSRDKLARVLHAVAADVRQNYGLVLSGDDVTWGKIMALLHAPREKGGLP